MKTDEIIKQLNEQLKKEQRQSSLNQIEILIHGLNLLLCELKNNKDCPNVFWAMQDQTKKLNEIMINY